MRNISFALTTQQFKDRTKTVTRRLGWANLEPGTELMGCEKCQGLGKGGQLNRLGIIGVRSVIREPLGAIREWPNDCALEGFPTMLPPIFMDMFIGHMPRWKDWKGNWHPTTAHTEVTRIEFEYRNLVIEIMPGLWLTGPSFEQDYGRAMQCTRNIAEAGVARTEHEANTYIDFARERWAFRNAKIYQYIPTSSLINHQS